MDHISSRDKEPEVDLESGLVVCDEDLSNTPVSGTKRQGKTLLGKFCEGFVDGLIKADGRQISCEVYSTTEFVPPENVKVATCKMLEANEAVDDIEKTSRKEKRKKTSNKKPPKPPRPPTGPSLDVADQKLIREISELAILKRARVERMKALKKMKAAKTSSSNSSMFAMVFTILFFLVLIFHGISSKSTTNVDFQGSPVAAGATDSGLISIQFPNPAAISNGPGSGSPNIVEQVTGPDLLEKM